MRTIEVSLPEPLKAFVETEIAEGRCRTPEEYLVSLVREAEKRKARQRVEALLQEALDSDEIIEATPAFWKRLRSEVEKSASKARKR